MTRAPLWTMLYSKVNFSHHTFFTPICSHASDSLNKSFLAVIGRPGLSGKHRHVELRYSQFT